MSLFASHLKRLSKERPSTRPPDEPAKPRTTTRPPEPASRPEAAAGPEAIVEPKAAEADPELLELLAAVELADEARAWPADRDGWPADTIDPPPPCGVCGAVDYWLPAIGGPWRCVTCCPCWKPKRKR
jgi:hypothetical protein